MGILYIVSTPIGNMEDLSLRAIKTLFSSNYILCEDTRKTSFLINYIKKQFLTEDKAQPVLISYYDQIELFKIPEIIALLKNNKNISLVSDAGTPLISDPGFKLVRECLINEIKVKSVPGPSSPISALSISGMPSDKFSFYGFLPEKRSHAVKFLKKIKERELVFKTTNIIFVSPYKIIGNLEDILDVFGDIEITIVRELTKIYEETKKNKISIFLKKYLKLKPKGELVILW